MSDVQQLGEWIAENRCQIAGCPNPAGEQTIAVRFDVDGQKFESAELRVCVPHYEDFFADVSGLSIDV